MPKKIVIIVMDSEGKNKNTTYYNEEEEERVKELLRLARENNIPAKRLDVHYNEDS